MKEVNRKYIDELRTAMYNTWGGAESGYGI